MFLGMIASGMAQGAQNVTDEFKRQEDQQNKLDFASYESQLRQGEGAAAAQLKQKLDQENMMFQVQGPYADAKLKNDLEDRRAEAAQSASPEMLGYTKAVAGAQESTKVHSVNPGDTLVQDGKEVYQNKSPTMAQVYQQWGNKKGTGGAGADHFDQKEIDKGYAELMGGVRSEWKDPLDPSGGSVQNAPRIAGTAYAAAIDNGMSPVQAQEYARQALDKTKQLGIEAAAKQGIKNPTTGQLLDLGWAALRKPKPAAAPPGGTPEQPTAPNASASAPDKKPGIIKKQTVDPRSDPQYDPQYYQ